MAATGALTSNETVCATEGCGRPVPKPKSKFCAPCAAARRSWQLKVNNDKWRIRKQDEEAGHRIMYQGKATQWARENPVEAVKLAVKEGFSDEMLAALLQSLK